jgi:hypothetical protein
MQPIFSLDFTRIVGQSKGAIVWLLPYTCDGMPFLVLPEYLERLWQ